MTHIATGFPTKKSLREHINAGGLVHLTDPSIFNPRSVSINTLNGVDDTLKPGEDCFVTNHPKRSWFAHIVRTADGSYKVL